MIRRNHRATPVSLALAAGVLAAVLLPGVAAWAQQASGPAEVSIDQVGWWTSRPGATATEEAGFEVATDGTGQPQSVAAVQVTLDATTVDSLAIALTESSALAEFASIAVCRIQVGWIAENPGALEDAPQPDCSTRVNLTRSADAMTWLGELAPLVRDGGTVSLAFLPEYRPPTTLGTGMVVRIAEIALEATGSDDEVDGAAPPTTSAAGPAPTTATTSVPLTTSPSPAPTAPAPSGSGASAPSGSGTTPVATPTTVAVVEIDRNEASDEEFFTLGPVEQQAAASKPWTRLVLLVPLSALVGAAAVRVRRAAIR